MQRLLTLSLCHFVLCFQVDPGEVMLLLNTLYMRFDQLTDELDVHKVRRLECMCDTSCHQLS